MRVRPAFLSPLLLAALSLPAAAADPPAADPSAVGGTAADLAAYAGGSANEAFAAALPLSDGTALIGGGADDLNWLPASVERIELAAPDLKADAGDRRPILLHLAADRGAVLRAYALPRGTGTEVRAIKTDAAPGEGAGGIYFSVTRPDGYVLAKLDGDALAASPAPRRLAWAATVKAGGTVREDQPWDVDGRGRVVYASGTPHGYDWLAIYRLDPDGEQGVVPQWRTHWLPDGGGEFHGPAADAPVSPTHSGVVLKVWSRGDLRSWDRAGWEEESPDGNGGVKRGRWPLDAMFPGPYVQGGDTPDLTGTGRGYYGYKWSATPTAGVGAIAVDRRDGSIVVGGNNKSRLPDGNPDFEPWVVCFEPDGAPRWWQRLYPESQGVSTPDQYVDALAIDYSTPPRPGALFVAARAHGNNVNNFWAGDAIRRADRPGWQAGFTGTNGNIHYSWLGKLTLDGGEMLAATYLAEFNEGAKFDGGTFADPALSHWPHFRAGWPNLNTTRVRPHSLHVDAAGPAAADGGRPPRDHHPRRLSTDAQPAANRHEGPLVGLRAGLRAGPVRRRLQFDPERRVGLGDGRGRRPGRTAVGGPDRPGSDGNGPRPAGRPRAAGQAGPRARGRVDADPQRPPVGRRRPPRRRRRGPRRTDLRLTGWAARAASRRRRTATPRQKPPRRPPPAAGRAGPAPGPPARTARPAGSPPSTPRTPAP